MVPLPTPEGPTIIRALINYYKPIYQIQTVICSIEQLDIISIMENKQLQTTKRKETLERYHSLTSPLVPLQTVQMQEHAKQEVRHNANMRLDYIKNRGSKVYALQTSQSYSELKAGAILYQVPQFSVPEVNYEVADHIKRKVEQIKQEVITRLPDISRSSNFTPKKLEHQLNHRSAVRELEQWLKIKLKQPPTTLDDTIQYKNMIMGVGMKELIRIIGKRCSEEGKITEQIWELTWGICRQIILHLSKRAKKCEQLLEEELSQMRMTYQKQYQRLNEENREQALRIKQLEAQNKQFFDDLNKAQKRREALEDKNRDLAFDNFYLQEEFKNVLEENLAIYLQIGDKNKRGWIKKMYKNIAQTTNHDRSQFQQIYQEQVATAVEQRNQLEDVTGDLVEPVTRQQIEKLGSQIIERIEKAKERLKRKSKKVRSMNRNSLRLTQGEDPSADVQQADNKSQYPKSVVDSVFDGPQCESLIHNMRQTFIPIDIATQTEKIIMTHAYASTPQIQQITSSFNVSPHELNYLEQIGVNTEQIKDPMKQSKKVAGKQNGKDDKTRGKSKLYSSGTSLSGTRDKSRAKLEKDRKNILQIVQEEQKAQPKEQMTQSARLSEHISYGSSFIDEVSKKYGVNMVKTHVNNRNSEMTVDKNSSMQRQEGGRLTDSLNRNKMVSIFNQHQSQSQSFLNNSLTAVERKSSPRTDKSSVVNIYAKPPENIKKQLSHASTEKKKEKSLNNSKEKDNTQSDGLKDFNIYLCANCNKIITEEDKSNIQKSPSKNKINPVNLLQPHKKSKRSSENSALNIASVRSFKKLLCPIESQDEERQYEGRRQKRSHSRRSSGYIHDIAYKKQMEGQMKSIFNRHDTSEQKGDQEQNKLNINKVNSTLWLINQLLESNKQWINSIGYNQLQSSESLDQYLEMVKQIIALPEGKINMSQKAVVSSIEKNVFPILNELMASVRKAVKSNKVTESMRLFTSLPNIVSNRISRKYGVRILAVKHLKILLLAFKAAAKFTERYKTLELMMFTDCKSPHSEDLFVYLLVMGLYDPTFSGTKSITLEQALTVRQVCEDNLSRNRNVYGGDWWNKQRPENEQIDLNELLRSILTNYRLLKINRIEELGFLYLMLKKDQWLQLKDFVTFIDVFKIDVGIKIAIVKKMLAFCDIRNRQNKLGISENMFAKFLTACDTLSLTFLEQCLNDQISSYFKDWQEFKQLQDKIYNKPIEEDKHNSNPQSRDEEELKEEVKVTSAPQISESSSKGQLMQSTQIVKSERIPTYLRHYSSLSYQICSYIQNEEETKFLTVRQRTLIKRYLLMHVMEGELEQTMGLIDYFSNSMLGLVCTPALDFAVSSHQNYSK